MRINVAVPEAHVDAPVLDAALESVTRLNHAMIKKGDVPSFTTALNRGIKWKPEPPGQEHFDHAGVVLGRKWGDCDDLAPYHAASLRASGEDPGARAIAKRSGPQRWHAVVQRSDGTIDDPSKRAGMGSHRGIIGGVLPLMYGTHHSVVGGAYIIRPQIAMRPVYGAYQARADLPWNWKEHLDHDKVTPTDMAMSSLHTAPTAASALTGAICGAIDLGVCNGMADPEHLNRLAAIADYVDGVDLEGIADAYGDHHAVAAQEVVGSFWSALKSVASPVAKLARGAIKFVPGIGPVADTALSTAENLYAKAKGSGVLPGTAALAPGGAPGVGPRGYTCTYF